MVTKAQQKVLSDILKAHGWKCVEPEEQESPGAAFLRAFLVADLIHEPVKTDWALSGKLCRDNGWGKDTGEQTAKWLKKQLWYKGKRSARSLLLKCAEFVPQAVAVSEKKATSGFKIEEIE